MQFPYNGGIEHLGEVKVGEDASQLLFVSLR
jgi:hypothetical protein